MDRNVFMQMIDGDPELTQEYENALAGRTGGRHMDPKDKGVFAQGPDVDPWGLSSSEWTPSGGGPASKAGHAGQARIRVNTLAF